MKDNKQKRRRPMSEKMKKFEIYKDGEYQNQEIKAPSLHMALKRYAAKGLIADFYDDGRVEFPDGSAGVVLPEDRW
jgi:hypothetical protein